MGLRSFGVPYVHEMGVRIARAFDQLEPGSPVSEPDYYAVLEVSPQSDDVVIQAAYRALMWRYHPDINSSDEAVKRSRELNAAYAIIGDPQRRLDYDRRRAEQSRLDKRSVLLRDGAHRSGAALASFQRHPTGRRTRHILLVSILLLAGTAGLWAVDPSNHSPAWELSALWNPKDLLHPSQTADRGSSKSGSTVPVRSVEDRPEPPLDLTRVEQAADGAAKFVLKKGMGAAETQSRKCHSAVRKAPSWDGEDACAVFDYTAAHIDEERGGALRSPNSVYFQLQRSDEADFYEEIGTWSLAAKARTQNIEAAVDAARAAALGNNLEAQRLRASGNEKSADNVESTNSR